jgi:hypothetical protein
VSGHIADPIQHELDLIAKEIVNGGEAIGCKRRLFPFGMSFIAGFLAQDLAVVDKRFGLFKIFIAKYDQKCGR